VQLLHPVLPGGASFVAGDDRDQRNHLHPGSREGSPPGTVGRLAADTEPRIVDADSGCELGTGQPGELRVRGPQNTLGHLGRPDATRDLYDRERWLRTGDLA
jgi:long-subunit acyl-CoA synthetase (AMP-forming)